MIKISRTARTMHLDARAPVTHLSNDFFNALNVDGEEGMRAGRLLIHRRGCCRAILFAFLHLLQATGIFCQYFCVVAACVLKAV